MDDQIEAGYYVLTNLTLAEDDSWPIEVLPSGAVVKMSDGPVTATVAQAYLHGFRDGVAKYLRASVDA